VQRVAGGASSQPGFDNPSIRQTRRVGNPPVFCCNTAPNFTLNPDIVGDEAFVDC
jgi:hypothetical protein